MDCVMELKGKRVLVFGTGISGIGADDLLEQVGASVILYDGNADRDPEEVRGKLREGRNPQIVIGELTDTLLRGVDLCVLSPGVPTDIPPVNRIRDAGIPIWGEVELAYACSRGSVLAITGTNGKTTTTTLLGEIMKAHAASGEAPVTDKVFVVGNIGTPYTEAALQTTDETAAVAEISSFQLETIESFHPRVSAITNITPDHLDRHHTMEAYVAAKMRICENQGPEDTCVLNYEDPYLRPFGETLKCRVLYFSSASHLEEGVCLEDGVIVIRSGGKVYPVAAVKDLKLPGVHNTENVMTAAAMAFAYGVSIEVISRVCLAFTAVEHRIEFVAEKGGVVYYNDSKGTNPDAAIRGIRAMSRPTVLIGGGYDKHNEYDEWIRAFDGKVRCLVLIGQTREAIAEAARRNGFDNIRMADTFEEAFAICVQEAHRGDAVLLSPACASWGMFPNYEVRGRRFKELVHALDD